MLLSLLSLALVASPPAWQAATAPAPDLVQMDPAVWTTPGARIPDLELPRVDGSGLVRLKDYEGKKLLLIHFASW